MNDNKTLQQVTARTGANMAKRILSIIERDKKQLRSLSHTLLGNNRLIACGDGSLTVYMRLRSTADGKVELDAQLDPMKASWLTPQDAAHNAPLIRNGSGTVARVVTARQALREHLREQKTALHIFTACAIEGQYYGMQEGL